MDEKLNELKEKQTEIGDKISLLRQTNKKKDEDAAEIRQLIAECRENLNRIKGIAPGTEVGLPPCEGLDDPMGFGAQEEAAEAASRGTESASRGAESTSRSPEGGSRRGDSGGPDVAAQDTDSGKRSEGSRGRSSGCGEDRYRPTDFDRKRCAELLAKRDRKPDCQSKKKKAQGKDKERVSCKVDLNKMKVRVRGPSEDLKKLDATQLINLLEKYQCQQLIINTGDEVLQDPGEIRLMYFTHPGNIVMIAGILMIAFLINANLCNADASERTKFLLRVLYLGSFAFHYGMVLGMSFIRGFALKFGLCNDTFHLVDNVILPKYYSLCVLLSALMLYSFLATHCSAPCTSWPLEVLAQMILVIVTFVMELVTICYVIPAVIKLRDATDEYVMDDDEDPDCSLPDSYEKNLKKLKKVNRTVCLVNFLTLVFLGANLYYITTKLNIGVN